MKKISIGLYKGVGDFFAATAASWSLKDDTSLFVLTYGGVAGKAPLRTNEQTRVISFGEKSRINFIIAFKFIILLFKIRPEFHIISDHAANPISIAKVLQLLVCKLLFIKVAGSCDDALSFFYKVKFLSVNNRELIHKDYYFIAALCDVHPFVYAVKQLMDFVPYPKKTFACIVHIGASTENKRFSTDMLNCFLRKFHGQDCCVIGASNELQYFVDQESLRGITFWATSFIDMLSLIKSCELFVGFDSAAANIANLFSKRMHIISGPARSHLLFHQSERLHVHRSNSACQSCGKSNCIRGDIACMNSFDIDLLFKKIN